MVDIKVEEKKKVGPYVKLPGRVWAEGEEAPLTTRGKKPVTVVRGTVVSVDTDKMLMDVELMGDRRGDLLMGVMITQPYAGNASYFSAVPEVGTNLVLVVTENWVFPITYIPNYNLALNKEHVELWDSDAIGSVQPNNDRFYKFRKIGEGEVSIGGKHGAGMHVGSDITLSTSHGDNIRVREEDNSIISSSHNNYVFASGVWSNSGVVQRNLMKHVGTDIGSFAVEDKHPGGSNMDLVAVNNASNPDYFTEYRVEVSDTGKRDMPENDVVRSPIDQPRTPAAVFSLGNFVGNNSHFEDTYGFVLKPTVFTDYDDRDGEFVFDVLTGDEPRSIGMSFSLFSPNRRDGNKGAFFGADKEGHFYHYLPAGSGGGIAQGRSMSLLALGSKKEKWGSDSVYGNSWDLITDGGVRWDIGHHNEHDRNPHKKLSMDVSTSSGVFFKYGINHELGYLRDFDDSTKPIGNIRKYKKIEVVEGFERKHIAMTRETIIGGSEKKEVSGKIDTSVGGGTSLSVGDSYSINIGNCSYEKVSNEKQEGFGSRTTKVTGGASTLYMLPFKPGVRSDIREFILGMGGKLTTLTTGGIREIVTGVGSRSFFSPSGSYSATLGTGNVSMKTGVGNISLQTAAGVAVVSSTVAMKLSAGPGINSISGTIINLKSNPIMGGVITTRSHFDYVTGAPLMGSKTVRAGL